MKQNWLHKLFAGILMCLIAGIGLFAWADQNPVFCMCCPDEKQDRRALKGALYAAPLSAPGSEGYVQVYEAVAGLEPVSHQNLNLKRQSDGSFLVRKKSGSTFRILQITDVHLTGSEENWEKDRKAVLTVTDLIARSKPDFIVMTGDLVFGTGSSDPDNDRRALDVLFQMMDAIGIPWTWAFGNHDHSFLDRYEESEITEMLSRCRTLRMSGGSQKITGYSNEVFQVENLDGSLSVGLIVLDSHNEIWNADGQNAGYDYIREDQVDWYENQVQRLRETYGEDARTLLFFHIPVPEYQTAWEELTTGGAGYLSGDWREPVASSRVNSGLFDRAVRLGSTMAMFCGHDHLNDYQVEYQGIRLVYGKSIDYVAYPGIEQQTQQRGATQIEIGPKGNLEVIPVAFE